MAEPLKDRFDLNQVQMLADRLADSFPELDRPQLVSVADKFGDLELKDRIAATADSIKATLPPNYPDALRIVIKTAELHDFDMFDGWPLSTFVERHGLGHPELSIRAMETITGAWTCEFAIRPFLTEHLDLTLAACHEWTRSSDPDVRRLASEGTRPLLPWAPRVHSLVDAPEVGLSILEKLRHDESEMVRRSVANHFNDVAKSAPALVTTTLKRWSTDPGVDMAMIRHALRTLVKNGDADALAILGFTTSPSVVVESFDMNTTSIHLGDSIELAAQISSRGVDDQRLVVDFVIHHPTKNGGISRKVFKWTNLVLGAGETVRITKRRKIQTATTRRYYQGEHRVELQIAGQVVGECAFELEAGSP